MNAAGPVVRSEVLDRVVFERGRQDGKWGGQPGIDRTHSQTLVLTVLGEEFGEVARAILENDVDALKEELIHVAAVAVAFVEELELREMER